MNMVKCILCKAETDNEYLCDACIKNINLDPLSNNTLPNNYSTIELIDKIDSLLAQYTPAFTIGSGLPDTIMLELAGAHSTLPRLPNPRTFSDALLLRMFIKNLDAENIINRDLLTVAGNLFFTIKGDSKTGVKLYEKAMKIKPSSDIYISLSILYGVSEMHDDALNMLSSVVDGDAIPEYLYADAMLTKKDAIDKLKKSILLDPNFFEACYFLSELLIRSGEYREALAYNDILCKGVSHPYALFQRATILNIYNDTDNAEKALDKIKQIYPFSQIIQDLSLNTISTVPSLFMKPTTLLSTK